QIGAEGAERVADRARALFLAGADLLALLATLAALPHAAHALGVEAVRDVAQHVEPGDALLLEQVERVAARLAEERDQHRGTIDGVALRAERVHGGALQHALDA